MRRKAAERAAINAPMQGTAADIIKKGMLLVDEWIQAEGDGREAIDASTRWIGIWSSRVSFSRNSKVVQELMESAADLEVPLVAEAGHGDNWDQAH